MLLAGRCRNPTECSVIQEVLQIHFKSNINTANMFTSTPSQSKLPYSSSEILQEAISQQVEGFGHVVWTRNTKRLAVLVGRALQFGEPVLLVGETGYGLIEMLFLVLNLFSSLLSLYRHCGVVSFYLQ